MRIYIPYISKGLLGLDLALSESSLTTSTFSGGSASLSKFDENRLVKSVHVKTEDVIEKNHPAKVSIISRPSKQRSIDLFFRIKSLRHESGFSCFGNMLSTFSLLFFFSFCNTLSAQHCSTTVPVEQCDATGITEGFLSAELLQCITKGQRTQIAIPFVVYSHIPNSTDSVYRMRIESVSNLPCGLCWVSGNTANTFNVSEGGCLVIQGTTNDVAGQYTLNVSLSFDTGGTGNWTQTGVSLNSLVTSTEKLILRLLNPEESCGGINYSISGNTAAGSCN